MDKLYTLCEKIDGIKFDYRNLLQRDKEDVRNVLNEVYNKYKNMVATSDTFYDILVEVKMYLQRLGYTYTYKLDEHVLKVTIEGIVLK